MNWPFPQDPMPFTDWRKKLPDLFTVLVDARALITNEREMFICKALPHDHPLVKWIGECLEGRYTYSGWVEFRHPDKYKEMCQKVGNKGNYTLAFREGRLQWLDKLINEARTM